LQIKKTIAAICHTSRAPLTVAEIDLPDELSCGQVLVEIHYSGICGAQINEIDAAKGPDKFLPHLLGHEASGTVLETGPMVKTVKKGDRVVLHWRPSEGIQSDTPAYRWNGQKVNAGWVTTFNRHAVISENRLTVIPPDFDLKIAPLFGCAVTTAMGVINNDAQVKIGQSVVVFGVGGVGLNICQAADMVAAGPVVGIDLLEGKIEMAKRYGASHGINSASLSPESLAAAIREIVGDSGADVVIDTTGLPRVIEQAYELTHKDGRTILVGVPKKGENISIYSLPLHFKKILKGSEGGSCQPHIDIPRYIRLVKQGRLKLEGLITHEFPLARINEAIDLVRSGQAGRVLLDMNS
jgi:S-(hydroxymethyl)glutathione dehydrogenase / alcohol dehydrogenase